MSDNLCTLTKSVRKCEVVLLGTCMAVSGLIQSKLIQGAKHFHPDPDCRLDAES